MITEIYVEGNKLDISADISSLLTFALDDIKDFSSRQTTFSKTVVLPGTANNNKIFGSIFETGISNHWDPTQTNIGLNFNSSVSAQCIIFQDFLQTFKGTLRLIEIDIDKHRIEYQAALNGNLTSLNVALSSALLEDLDFTEYNQEWNVANIVGSWFNPMGSGVYFPHIDYGTYSVNKHDWIYRTFRPALYVKEYIDKMFAATGTTTVADVAGKLAGEAALNAAVAGGATPVAAQAAYDAAYDAAFTAAAPAAEAGVFRYQCDLFNTPRFKSLIVPHNKKDLTSLTGNILSATSSTSQHIINHTGGVNVNNVIFPTILGGFFTNVGGQIFTYVGTDTITTTLNLQLSGKFNFKALSGGIPFNFNVIVQKNSVNYYTDGVAISNNTGFDTNYTKNYAITLTLAPGDTFNVEYILSGGPAGPADVFVTTASLGVVSTTVLASPLDYNQMINMQDVIPQNIRQVDFLVSIVKLFNLYVYEDQFDDHLIHITPFVDFFSSAMENVVDWTYKMDRNQMIKVKPMSELNSRIYNFNFADDSDYYNDLYNKRYNQGYGSYIYDSLFEFATETNTLALVFAATPLVGYTGEDKVYPTIFKRSGTTEETTDSVIRIMQAKKMPCEAYAILETDGVTALAHQIVYGYAGHFDDPNNPDNDLNFGALNEVFFPLVSGDLSQTQFNVYWSAYMAEITDKDSKLLTAQFYLRPIDIFNLNFAVFITIDGTLFRLNKITDYNATMPGTCECELLKVINSSYTFPIGGVPASDRTLDWETGDELEYTPGIPIFYF